MLVLESGDDEQPGDHADMTAEEGGNTSRNSKHAVCAVSLVMDSGDIWRR